MSFMRRSAHQDKYRSYRSYRSWGWQLALGAVLLWLVAHMVSGERGLFALAGWQGKIAAQEQALAELKTENADLRARIMRLRDPIDFDFLDERVRDVLGHVHRQERVILY